MTFQKLGYVQFKPVDYNNFAQELTAKIINLLGADYYDNITIHVDNCGEPEGWLDFSADDINYKKLIGELLTQEEYDALVENNATVILFY